MKNEKSSKETWRQLFWDVLFPLLENVENEIKMADKSKSSDSKNFLVHHSRDTKEKQWAETKRLTLNGLAKLFKGNFWRFFARHLFEIAFQTCPKKYFRKQIWVITNRMASLLEINA